MHPIFGRAERNSDPMILYGSGVKQAGREYACLMEYAALISFQVGKYIAKGKRPNRNRRTLSGFLADIRSKKDYRSEGRAALAGGKPVTGDVSVPFGEPGDNRQGNLGVCADNFRNDDLTKNDTGASDLPVAPVVFCCDHKKVTEEYICHPCREDKRMDQMTMKEYLDTVTGSRSSKV